MVGDELSDEYDKDDLFPWCALANRPLLPFDFFSNLFCSSSCSISKREWNFFQLGNIVHSMPRPLVHAHPEHR